MQKNRWRKEVPVYLFTGFLESGKTQFLKEALTEPQFATGEKNLVIMCEEGEVEIDASEFPHTKTDIIYVEDQEDINEEFFMELNNKYLPDKVLVEYNGMWMLDPLYLGFPENWMIVQEMTFVDSNTFTVYNNNMRNLVYDKFRYTDMVIFNRFPDTIDFMEFHKIVRVINRSCQIIYESPDGTIKVDEVVDPLPFDVEADKIDLEDRDFAYWYQDINAEPNKYKGKTVIFNGFVKNKGIKDPDKIIIGRPMMTCCEEDIAFAGYRAIYEPESKLVKVAIKDGEWARLTCICSAGFSKQYNEVLPLLKVKNIEYSPAPEDTLAVFY